MKRRRQPIEIISPVEGLIRDQNSTFISGRASPELKGFRFDKGVLKKDFGYKTFGGNLPLTGTQLMWIDQYYKLTGTSHLLAATVDKVYEYNTGTSNFDDVTKVGQDFTGDEDNFFRGVIMNDNYHLTNGVDKIQVWSGSGKFADLSSTTNLRFKSFVVFNAYMIGLHVTDTGTTYPQRIMWCDTGDPTDWTTGNSGLITLDDYSDWVVDGMEMLGRMLIYKERSIYELIYVGYPDIFIAANLVTSIGLSAPNTLVDLAPDHAFLGPDNVYLFDGRDPTGIADKKILDYLFGTAGVLNTSMLTRAWMTYIEERQELWLGAPTMTDLPDKCLKYNMQTKSWTKRPLAITCIGFYSAQTGMTWNDLVGDWTDQDWRWSDRQISGGAPTTLLGDKDGYVYIDDGVTFTDNGVAFEALFETKDFDIPQSARLVSFDFETKG